MPKSTLETQINLNTQKIYPMKDEPSKFNLFLKVAKYFMKLQILLK